MKKHNLFAFILLSAAVLTSCDPKKPGEKHFSFDENKFKPHYVNGSAVDLELMNPENKKIDSIVYYINDQKIASVKGHEKSQAEIKDNKLGYQSLKALVYFDGDVTAEEITSRIEVVSGIVPKVWKYTVVNTYAHDSTSFTQGLEFHNDTLIESTGQNGTSYIRKWDYKTGKVFKQIDLEQQYFGEGITILDNKIYQLTWRSGVGFIYDAGSLKRLKSFNYDKEVEGWGIAHDGTNLYQSDGTEKIWTIDPKTLKMTNHVNVYSSATKIKSVNELEWINGSIYGNIWQRDAIAVIDPTTGAVTAVIDLKGLRSQVKSKRAEALNGIAYNPRTKTIFVTGKMWDKMFEIRLLEN